MHGISIDDEPDAPVGTPAMRRSVAIHWNWTTEYTEDEIASALGVTPRTVRNYLSDGPTDAVREQMDRVEQEVRMVAVSELRSQLQAAGSRAKTAEKPVEVYENDAGDVVVKDVTDDMGEVVKRVPMVQDIKMLPDEESRYYARAEVRDILDQLTDLVGAGEPEKIEHTGDATGIVIDLSESDDE